MVDLADEHLYVGKGRDQVSEGPSRFAELPAKWATSDSFMRDPDFFKYIELFWIRESGLLTNIATSSIAAFNPFKAYKALTDAQSAAQAAAWN